MMGTMDWILVMGMFVIGVVMLVFAMIGGRRL